ncbi:MAG: 5'-nucleotidase C-terminal domain-containing protein, partial [Bdellovibrio sp.]|nr:5'-nucleotidase C-terminal domain-containing protein [Bdellovibrio sp.]
GDLLLDLEKRKPLKIVHYRLIPVPTTGDQDPEIVKLVLQARATLEDKYGKNWFYEPLIYSDIPLERPLSHATRWGDIYADAIKEAIYADVSIDVGEFFGGTRPAGIVTRETLFQFYPRVFDVYKPYGWTIWEIQTAGSLLKWILDTLLKNGTFMNTSGVQYNVVNNNNSVLAENVRVNGYFLDPNKTYRIAVSEGIGRGSSEAGFILKRTFRPKDSGISIWHAVEEKLKKIGPVVY